MCRPIQLLLKKKLLILLLCNFHSNNSFKLLPPNIGCLQIEHLPHFIAFLELKEFSVIPVLNSAI
jgi:hypothetical protein